MNLGAHQTFNPGCYKLDGPITLNESLMDQMKVRDRDHLYALHETKRDIFRDMLRTPLQERHHLWAKVASATQIEYLLQAAWGFEMDNRYHRFWDLPHCICASDYNNARYGALMNGHITDPLYTMKNDCLLHGFRDFLDWWWKETGKDNGPLGENTYYNKKL